MNNRTKTKTATVPLAQTQRGIGEADAKRQYGISVGLTVFFGLCAFWALMNYVSRGDNSVAMLWITGICGAITALGAHSSYSMKKEIKNPRPLGVEASKGEALSFDLAAVIAGAAALAFMAFAQVGSGLASFAIMGVCFWAGHDAKRRLNAQQKQESFYCPACRKNGLYTYWDDSTEAETLCCNQPLRWAREA